jgi:redox-sensitive bicupin YhaK (pirin superfamily)
MYASRLSADRGVTHEFAEGRGGYLYLISGTCDANGTKLGAGDAAYVTAAGALDLRASETSELLLIDTPLR